MAKPSWDQTWTIEAATDTVAKLVVNPDGKATITLTAHRSNHKVVYYAVTPTNAPQTWKDVILFPMGSRDVPDNFEFNPPPPDPGPLSSKTAAAYLPLAVDMEADVEQDLNNFRLMGDLNTAATTGDSAAVTLYMVQRAADPKHWYLVVYVHGAGANPDGGGVGHH